MEFGNVCFSGGRKTGVPEGKPSEQGREPITNSSHICNLDGIKLGATLVAGERSHRYAIPASCVRNNQSFVLKADKCVRAVQARK